MHQHNSNQKLHSTTVVTNMEVKITFKTAVSELLTPQIAVYQMQRKVKSVWEKVVAIKPLHLMSWAEKL